MGKSKKLHISCIASADERDNPSLEEGLLFLIRTSACSGLSVVNPCLPGRNLFVDIKEDVVNCKVNCLIVDSQVALFCDSVSREVGEHPVKVIAVFFKGEVKQEEVDRLRQLGIVIGDEEGIFYGSDAFERACRYAIKKGMDQSRKSGAFPSSQSIIEKGPSVEWSKQDITRHSTESAYEWSRGYDRDD